MRDEQRVYEVLGELGVAYIRHEHPPVYTVEEAQKYWDGIQGAHCKNLFLRNKKGKQHYLVILKHSKRMDLKNFGPRINEDKLSFASEERLRKYLGLSTGAVSPFGLINDREKHVRIVLDEELTREELINFHPNVNTATISLAVKDFMKFLQWCGNDVSTLEFS